jgi:hypothetical protein
LKCGKYFIGGKSSLEKMEKNPANISKAQHLLNAVWPFVATRKARLILILAFMAIGMYFNWGWFVAAGVAPIILTLLPCAAMCAMGMCMGHDKK